jgi:tetratricopeptide (TPR) repeat protein
MAKQKSTLPKNQTKLSTATKTYPKWFYVVLVFIPIAFFAVLELGLRAFNYGNAYDIFVPSASTPSRLVLNPELPFKYFRGMSAPPTVIPDEFDRVKSPDALRVFIFGESSTAGYPYPYTVSFPAYLRRALESLYPNKKIEVVNFGIAAICTYTIRDIAEASVHHSPDLVIFYNGHNEYYGVLGIGSSVRFGSSRVVTNLLLMLQSSRLFQLIQNSIGGVVKTATPEEGATLMSRVVGESAIAYQSDAYQRGLDQYDANMRQMLQLFGEKRIPVVLGKLVSNLKDQKPFVSLAETPNADAAFESARAALAKKDTVESKRLFLLAKDLDGLRFRAPEAMNERIELLAKEFGAAIASLDQVFSMQSPQGIVGDNLMCDHLHPTVAGYQLMGKSLLETALSHRLLPAGALSIPLDSLHRLTLASLPYSPLDEQVASIRLAILKNSYPFVPKGQPNLFLRNFKPTSFLESLALNVLQEKVMYDVAHLQAAERSMAQGDTVASRQELESLTAKFPLNEPVWSNAARVLVKQQRYDLALRYFLRAAALKPTAYSTKWIGQILLTQNNAKDAARYLEQSISLGSAKDAQVYYNLAGAYYNLNQPDKTMNALKTCLELAPTYPNAKRFYEQLRAEQ